MKVLLEPIFLANVLLFIPNGDTIQDFPFVSKNCLEATLTLKANPQALSNSPREILQFFPNINMMVVKDSSSFGCTDALPDTVTALLVECVNFEVLTDEHLKLADCVVEIQDCLSNRDYPQTSPSSLTSSDSPSTASLTGSDRQVTNSGAPRSFKNGCLTLFPSRQSAWSR